MTPICLPSPNAGAVGSRCYVTGWGVSDVRRTDAKYANLTQEKLQAPRTTKFSDPLRQVDVVIEEELCDSVWGITPDEICAYNPDKDRYMRTSNTT